MKERQPILSIENINKTFPGVKALTDVTLALERGEVRGLVGENGAGKSTLMKILTGVLPKDSGEVRIDGEPVHITSPLHAQQLGLSIIFQEFNLVDSLSISENIFAGRQPVNRFGTILWKDINAAAEKLLRRVGLELNPKTLVGRLSVAQKQMVEIAKALSFESKIIIMDEPSATLTSKELENLFAIIDNLKKEQITVIYISHRLDEIFRLCDNVTVIRDGCVVETRPVTGITKDEIISLMVGRDMENEYPKRADAPTRDVLLEVKGLTRQGVFSDISFQLHKGEILGIAGLVGSGRTEIMRCIFGADKLTSGEIYIEGEKKQIRSPEEAIGNGIALLTEDRKQQGLVLPATITANTTLAALLKVSKGGFMDAKKEKRVAEEYIEALEIKTPGAAQVALNLSGGNQQKVVIAKWLFTDAKILILDEPTRGIDVGAKYEIYQLIHRFVQEGKGVIMISSEMPEVINMSDRLLVVHEGRLKGELSGEEKTAEAIMRCAILKEGEEANAG